MVKFPEAELTSTSNGQSKTTPASTKKSASNKVKSPEPPDLLAEFIANFKVRRHALLLEGISEVDDPEVYQKLLEQIKEEKKPVGVDETFLVESIASLMMRIKRARLFEAEYINNYCTPNSRAFHKDLPKFSTSDEISDPLVRTHQRYETNYVKELRHARHELERLQRMRLGEAVPAPAAVDVSVDINVHEGKGKDEPPIIEQEFPDPKKATVQ
jgi:hypothetical protein